MREELIHKASRVVIKLGTGVLTDTQKRIHLPQMEQLVDQVAHLCGKGRQIVLVTSGAVGAGMEALGMRRRPESLPDLQMAAAVGQCKLITRYDELFKAQGHIVGQVLLTHADFQHKMRLTNARRTLENLLRHGVIPIINENDVVADEEIRADLALGDNDFLASLVAKLIRADLLIMLTTVDGVKKRDPAGRMRRVRYIESIDRNAFKLVSDKKSSLSKGGMRSKLKAAESVTKAGGLVVIANGRTRGILPKIMRGEDVGTIALPAGI